MAYSQSIFPLLLGRDWWDLWDFPQYVQDQDFGLTLLDDEPRPYSSRPNRQHFAVRNDLNKFQVRLDVSHFLPEEISVKTVDDAIVVHGKHEERPDQHGFISREFTRRYALPPDVEPNTVTSSLCADGVLLVEAPKKCLEPPFNQGEGGPHHPGLQASPPECCCRGIRFSFSGLGTRVQTLCEVREWNSSSIASFHWSENGVFMASRYVLGIGSGLSGVFSSSGVEPMVFWIIFDFYLLKKMDQRTCIKFCVKNEIKCADAFRMLTVAYGEATLDRSNVYRWYKMFSEGREDVNDEERAGRPSTSTTDEKINEVEKMILANRRITVREVAEDLNISIGSCHSIFINDLGMRRVAAKFVPKLLNCDQNSIA
ncbi:hypothetical protein LAZ67_X000611 [Cordylochernes scorpioides]|uniref:SHSP domain-containing protein n=1 Tax=Cordylochernes scorpioides TaxID=51811 RepID=A0ABY6LRQ9_9ARAC|nr:hypothetical protein LAZ67_X000611 [Cordylochernes scorpioides]